MHIWDNWSFLIVVKSGNTILFYKLIIYQLMTYVWNVNSDQLLLLKSSGKFLNLQRQKL